MAQCLTIESILVDACTLGGGCPSSNSPTCSCEGKNEMMRLSVGAAPITVADLDIDWANNSFQGFCQDAQTAQHVEELNATIENCGWLQEPENGILPANASVLIITSSDMCTASNSFAGLSDTLTVLFQCAGNFQGHFANFGSGLRTTTVSVDGECPTSVTYDRGLLVDQNGNIGGEDGALVTFAADGTATYSNNGCTAPFAPQVVDAGEDQLLCGEEPVPLNATVQGSFSAVEWSGGTGTFGDANAASTTYTPGVDDGDTVTLTFTATNCNGTITDEIELSIGQLPQPVISFDGPEALCDGESTVLNATGVGAPVWNTGDEANAITVTEPGTYTVTFSNECGSSSASQDVSAGTMPQGELLGADLSPFCEGESIALEVIANGPTTWNTGDVGTVLTVTEAGTYTATVTTTCGSIDLEAEIEVTALPEVSVFPGAVVLCNGESVLLNASSDDEVTWSDGTTTDALEVSNAGVYTATVTNECGTAEASAEVEVSTITAEIEGGPFTGGVPFELVVLNGTAEAVDATWFVDGTFVGEEDELNYLFDTPGTFELMLVATNADGCDDVVTVTVIVNDCPDTPTVLPNIFSPNDDNVNDEFTFIADCLSDLSMQVFNRWGTLVFEASGNAASRWNGKTSNGDDVSEGTYVVSLKFTDLEGESRAIQQHVLITR